ncbi:DUF1566 domain-containing protein [Candidatus Nomurabacteria bacterium]|nr:DUF1566 domain-containing protein [Candidatus Nomurabacteria bacterium]
MTKIFKIISYLLVAVLVGITVSFAGSLTPPGSPANTMYSLTDIYNLSAGTTTTEGAGTIPSTPGGVASTGKTLTEVYTAISDQIALLANNKIAKDITAFGYTGTLYGDTDPSKVLTTATYAGTAVAGTPPTEWANLDMSGGYKTWTAGNTYCLDLVEGGHSDWRLPYLWELSKLSKEGYTTGSTGLGGSSGLQDDLYWSDLINLFNSNNAISVDMLSGLAYDRQKADSNSSFVRCVR